MQQASHGEAHCSRWLICSLAVVATLAPDGQALKLWPVTSISSIVGGAFLVAAVSSCIMGVSMLQGTVHQHPSTYEIVAACCACCTPCLCAAGISSTTSCTSS